jgi:hypothetical protein
MLSRLLYRFRQFLSALTVSTKRIESLALLPHLSPSQVKLFRRMQPSEQVHAFEVCERLSASGQTDPDLLVAALLHDAGKVHAPLSLLERVMVVLGKRFFRRRSALWGQGAARGLQRPFVVAARHAEWGSQLAESGTSPTVFLIRRTG